ncbi:MAG: family 78 glycoside hydrolase catalytic domain [Solobacterium sp.]|nr:family 78 glycoside hydrolase catalytic domain [Solobacterium sp.]
MRLYDLKTNHETELLGIDSRPYFSWKMMGEEENTEQVSCRIVVKDGSETVWDSGTKESAASLFVPYQGVPLKSRTRYTWTVSATDNHGNTAEADTLFETAFKVPEDWKAVWIENPRKPAKRKKGFGNQPAPTLFRRTFEIEGEIASARLYATCHGIYEASVNRQRADDRLFAPEYTSYEKLLCYQVYDVTDLLHTGKNALGMQVADGWYFCPVTTMNKKTAKQPHAALYQLEVTLRDGSLITVCSDGSETCSTGPVCFSDLFAGEQYDARRELPGWDTPEFDETGWEPVKKGNRDVRALQVQTGKPVRAVKEIPAQNAYVSPKGEHIVDFGQVLAGHVHFRVNAPEGTEIVLEHFEIPDQNGNYFNNILGTSGIGEGVDQKVVYISDGKEAVYEAKFSFHGFRYIRISGMDEIHKEDFTAVAVSTDKVDTGTFECSDERLNRLYENTRWSQRSNMLSIPTDCPQREKAGWTGDIGIYAAASLQNEDTTGLLERWLKSVTADQMNDGAVPMVVPCNQTYQNLNLLLKLTGGMKGNVGPAGWGDACILVPLAMYEQTGNTEVLKMMYPVMKKWCDFIIRCAQKYRGNKKIPKETDRYLWNTGFHYGEWLIPSRTKNGLSDAKSMSASMKDGVKYIPEVYAYLAMKNFAAISGLLGKNAESAYYLDMAGKMKQAFADGVITKEGTMPVDVMGAYIISLHYGLVPENLRESFVQIILKKIEENQGCLDTGFLGTPVILDTLCENGHVREAYDLLFQNRCPSWLYEVENGATTIWESWITKQPDGTPMAVSLNHYAFGCVDDWMFRNICGLQVTSPGYRTFRIQPLMDERITHASRTFESEYGMIRTAWKKDADTFTLDVTVPAGTKAEIILPDGQRFERGSGTYSFSCMIG